MVAPVTAKFEELVLELETATPGTYANTCGLTGFTYSRSANVDTIEVPADCTDESLPYSVQKQVRSLDFGVQGDAVWAQQSHEDLLDWFYSSATKNIRVRHVAAATGDTEYETGPALLTKLDNIRTKGQKVTGSIEITFDGTPTRTAKP